MKDVTETIIRVIAEYLDKDASEIKDLLRGNTCGFKQTSCADQLAKAVTMARNGAR